MADDKDLKSYSGGSDDKDINKKFPADNIDDSFFDDFESNYSFFASANEEENSLFDEDYMEKEEEDSIDIMSSSTPISKEKKASAKNKKKSKKEQKNSSKKATVLRVLLSVFLVGLITTCLVVGAFAVYVFVFIDDTVHENLNELKLDFTTMVYVENPETGEYEEYQPLHGEYNRKWVAYNELQASNNDPTYDGIPKQLADAFVAIEDERFYTHGGVDWKRTIGAFANMFLDFWSTNQGGSTITQQLVKNLTDDRDQNAMRKVREIMRARYLESEYSKDTILECYLNTISMAGGIYGVEVASNYYFDKPSNELTLVECAALASIAKEPERYRPDKHPNNNKDRRALVLGKMLECGFITQAEYDEAIDAELVVAANKDNVFNEEDNSYFIDALIEDVIDGLMEKYEMDESYASRNFYNGGYKIYATLDPEIQDILEAEYENMSHFPVSSKTGAQSQSAMTVMDYNGHIVATVGGVGKKTGLREYNRATMSNQAPGSSIKPISVYAPALEYNIITYSSYYKDKKINLGGWSPSNAYRGYYGTMTVAKAVELSCNTIAVQTLQDLSLESSFDFITNNMGITTLVKEPEKDLNYSALALGGGYDGITVTESAAAFATFGNLGKYYKPTTYVKVTDQHNKVVLSYDAIPTVAMGEDTATIMNKILQRVIYEGSGTAKSVASFHSEIKAFGKTGTSSNYYDRWFVGGTPYYVASCWYGFDQNEEINNRSEVLVLWKNVMQQIHKDLPTKEFIDSQFVTRRKYCTDTGLVATANCTSTGTGYYKTSYMPTCTKHKGQVSGEVKDESSKVSTTTSSSKPASSSSTPSASSSKVDSTTSAEDTEQDTNTDTTTSSVEPAE